MSGVNKESYLSPSYIKQYFFSISLFIVCYMLSNFLNSLRPTHLHLYFNWELQIPFLPWMIVFYGSLYLIPIFLPFVFSKKEFFAILRSINVTLVLALFVFLLTPTVVGFPRALPEEWPWKFFYTLLHSADYPHNLFPSYHVILASLIFFPLLTKTKGIFRVTLFCWMVLIDISILFVHQHHTPDLVAGVIIGYAAFKRIYLSSKDTI